MKNRSLAIEELHNIAKQIKEMEGQEKYEEGFARGVKAAIKINNILDKSAKDSSCFEEKNKTNWQAYSKNIKLEKGDKILVCEFPTELAVGIVLDNIIAKETGKKKKDIFCLFGNGKKHYHGWIREQDMGCILSYEHQLCKERIKILDALLYGNEEELEEKDES